jgi:hypothetical protein
MTLGVRSRDRVAVLDGDAQDVCIVLGELIKDSTVQRITLCKSAENTTLCWGLVISDD